MQLCVDGLVFFWTHCIMIYLRMVQFSHCDCVMFSQCAAVYIHLLALCNVWLGSAVTGSVQGYLEDDKSRFHRMPSVDAFNEVLVHI